MAVYRYTSQPGATSLHGPRLRATRLSCRSASSARRWNRRGARQRSLYTLDSSAVCIARGAIRFSSWPLAFSRFRAIAAPERAAGKPSAPQLVVIAQQMTSITRSAGRFSTMRFLPGRVSMVQKHCFA